jgi:hypothetical protein
MYQSAPRKNSLDILADPTTIALLGSIALHALIGASLPFLNSLEPENKKADPGTVKVVELTPSELQRIPQAPPTPKPQVFTPPPTIPSTKVVTQPSIAPIPPNSPTVPFSPIQIPLGQTTPNPPKGVKDQQAIPQPQPTEPIFDPKISLNPVPKSSQSPTPDKRNPAPKPSPTPITTKPQKTDLIPFANSDDDGDFQPFTPAPSPSQQAQSTNSTRPAGGSSQSKPAGQPSGQSSGSSSGGGGDGNSSFPYPYGRHDAAVRNRLAKYRNDYPGIKEKLVEPLLLRYPQGTLCPKVGQGQFTVLMVAFDKEPKKIKGNPLGNPSAPSIDEPFVAADQDTPENRKLAEIAVDKALSTANTADQNRQPNEKNKQILYMYTVRFDPTSCQR